MSPQHSLDIKYQLPSSELLQHFQLSTLIHYFGSSVACQTGKFIFLTSSLQPFTANASFQVNVEHFSLSWIFCIFSYSIHFLLFDYSKEEKLLLVYYLAEE